MERTSLPPPGQLPRTWAGREEAQVRSNKPLLWHTSAKINFSYFILFHLTTSYSSYFGGKKGISRNKTSFFLLMQKGKGMSLITLHCPHSVEDFPGCCSLINVVGSVSTGSGVSSGKHILMPFSLTSVFLIAHTSRQLKGHGCITRPYV